MTASILALSVSDQKGVKKRNVDSAELVVDRGILGDAHAGPGKRQISLLARESIEKIRAAGLDVGPGDFAENITTEGIDLPSLPVGTRLRLGDEVLCEVTQIGKTCHSRCEIFQQVGDCVMPREGIFVKVLVGGALRPGEALVVEQP